MALNRGAEVHVCNVWAIGGNVTENYNGAAWTLPSPAAGGGLNERARSYVIQVKGPDFCANWGASDG